MADKNNHFYGNLNITNTRTHNVDIINGSNGEINMVCSDFKVNDNSVPITTPTLQEVTDEGSTTSNAVSITDTTQSTSVSTGSLTLDGGLGIDKNLHVGGDVNMLDVNKLKIGTTDTMDLYNNGVDSYINNDKGWLNILGKDINGSMQVGDLGEVVITSANTESSSFPSTFQSTSVSTGAITTDGGVGIAKNLFVGGAFNLDDYQLPDGHIIGDIQSTGILSGGELSVASGTTISITDGDGIITNTTTPSAPVTTEVSWTGLTGITITNLANGFTFIYITTAGTVLQSLVEPTPTLRRDNMFIGKVFHTDGATVTQVNDSPDTLDSGHSQVLDFFRGLGPIVISGLRVSANGANLSYDRTAGSLHQTGIEFHDNVQSPNIKDYAVDTLASFVRSNQLTIPGTLYTTLDPGNYDNAGTITAIPGSGARSTNMRVYFFNSAGMTVQYGQTWYGSLAEAEAAVATEAFVIEPLTLSNGILIAVISIRKDATDLSDTSDAVIFNASKFGEVSIGVGGTATANFQNVYDNSNQPQIIVNSTGGGLQIRDAASPIGANLFEVQDNSPANILTATATDIKVGSDDTTGNNSLKLYGSNSGSYLDMKTDGSGNKFYSSSGAGNTYLSGSTDLLINTGTGDILMKTTTTTKNIRIGESATSGNVRLGDTSQTGNIEVKPTTNSTSTTTGAMIVRGGLGVVKDIQADNVYANNISPSCGTVTQSTSVSTAVTLNTHCGVITTYGTGTISDSTHTSFIVNNSVVTSSSVIFLTTESIPSRVINASIDVVGSGVFTVIYTTNSSLTAAGPFKINFLVINP